MLALAAPRHEGPQTTARAIRQGKEIKGTWTAREDGDGFPPQTI